MGSPSHIKGVDPAGTQSFNKDPTASDCVAQWIFNLFEFYNIYVTRHLQGYSIGHPLYPKARVPFAYKRDQSRNKFGWSIFEYKRTGKSYVVLIVFLELITLIVEFT